MRFVVLGLVAFVVTAAATVSYNPSSDADPTTGAEAQRVRHVYNSVARVVDYRDIRSMLVDTLWELEGPDTDVVVAGEIKHLSDPYFVDPDNPTPHIQRTDSQVQVLDTLYVRDGAEPPGQQLTLRQNGVLRDGVAYIDEGEPIMLPGERYVLFLKAYEMAGQTKYYVTGGFHGRFQLLPDGQLTHHDDPSDDQLHPLTRYAQEHDFADLRDRLGVLKEEVGAANTNP